MFFCRNKDIRVDGLFFTKNNFKRKLYSFPDHENDGNKQSSGFLHDAIEPSKTEFFDPFGSYFGFSGDYIDHPAAEVYYSYIKMVSVVMGEEFFFGGGDADEQDVGSKPIDLFHNFVFFFGCEVAVDTWVNGFNFIVVFYV